MATDVTVRLHSRDYYASQMEHQRKALVAREQGDGSIAPMPHTVSLAVNNACFLRCKHCDVGEARRVDKKNFFYYRTTGDTKKLEELPMSRLKELADELAPHGGVIRPAFLEPLLRKDLFELAEYSREKGLFFSLQTNGVLLPKLYRQVVDSGVRMLRVSLDGPPEVHDSIRGVPGTFAKAVDGLRKVLDYHAAHGSSELQVGISYVISGESHSRIVDFMHCMKEHGLLERIFIAFSLLRFITPLEAERQNAIDFDFFSMTDSSLSCSGLEAVDHEVLSSQLEELLRAYPRDTHSYHFFPTELSRDGLRKWFSLDDHFFAPQVMCHVPWSHCHVMYNGDVVVNGRCCSAPLGNIMESSLAEIWNGEKARAFRRKLLELGNFPACNRCCRKLPEKLLE